MADIRAIATGNWSNPATWNGGVIPGPGDRAYSNAFTVTIDSNRTCTQVSNGIGGGGGAGGVFILPAGVTLTADVLGGVNNAAVGFAAVVFSAASPGVASIVGNLTGGGANNRAVDHNGTGTLNITGTLLAGTGSASYTLTMWTVGGVANVVGNVSSSPTSSGFPINMNVGGVSVNITGNLLSPGTGSAVSVVDIAGAGSTLSVTGSVTAGAGNGIRANGTNAIITVNGAIYSSASKNGVLASGSGNEVRTTGPCYNSLGSGLKSMMAVFCESVLMTPTPGLAWQFYQNDHATPAPLYYAGASPGNPIAANVRQGVVYGPGGSVAGTMQVPPAASVVAGALVDHTVGLAVLTEQAATDAFSRITVALQG